MSKTYIISKKLNKINNILHAFATRECKSISDILKNQFGLNADKVFTVRQVHGDNIFVINSPLTTHHSPLHTEADAIITNIKNLPIGVLTADCLPIILADVRGRGVGIIHAGRIGTYLEITKKAVGKMREVFDISAKDIIAVIGPGIGVCCYEIDEKSIKPFKEKLNYIKKIATRNSSRKWMLNLKESNKIQLLESGLRLENIFATKFCTSCHNDKFFSYRREGKEAGRMVSFIAIRE